MKVLQDRWLMKKQFYLMCIIVLLALQAGPAGADPLLLSGQAAAWVNAGSSGQTGFLYIPEFRATNPLSMGTSMDMDFSWKIVSVLQDDTRGDLYRGWLRHSTSRYELRAGLQKINFGPARLLRTLMWFDAVDPRDPLQLTNGVYALLGRYYFQNNANIWVWGLAGNNNLKGLELYQTDTSKMEYGGRYQFPVPKGEFAFSNNQRYIDKNEWYSKMTIPMTNGLEQRFAIDGSWDLGVGLWCEGSLNRIQVNDNTALYEKMYTIGSDYTLDIGPGVHVLAEHFVRSRGFSMNSQSPVNILSAGQVDFQLTMLDRFYAIAYYDWQADKFYPYVRVQRTYDNWQINLMAYSMAPEGPGVFQGSGVTCMFVYNY